MQEGQKEVYFGNNLNETMKPKQSGFGSTIKQYSACINTW